MSNEKLDVPGVKAKFGVPPEQIVDYLALIGDAVDNIPGVDKVGPKTAAKWIAQYGSLEGVLAHADEITGVVGENLRKARDWLPKARELVTVKRDVALPFKVADLAPRERDREALAALFQRFGFKSWLRDVQGDGDPPAAVAPAPAPASRGGGRAAPLRDAADRSRPRAVARADRAGGGRLRRHRDDLARSVRGGAGRRLVRRRAGRGGLSPARAPCPGAPEQLGVERALALLRPWLEDASKRKLGQNLKYDQHVLANHGVRLAGVVHDTLLQSYVLESSARHDMDTLAERYLGLKTITYDEVTGKGAQRIGFEQVDVQRATEYSAEDADVTLRLHQVLYPKLAADEKLKRVYETIEMPVREVLFRMERNGVLIDAAQLDAQSRELGQKMLELEQKACAEAGQPFNLSSPKQIGEIFFERLKLPVVKKTPSGAPSTDEDVLEKLALDYPLPKTLLEYRSVSKLKSTYTDKLPRMVNPKTGRVHTTYGQTTAVTGRLASNDPNLQNIPVRTPEGRRIREAFIAPPGHAIVSADYSQIELRIMAHLSRRPGPARRVRARRGHPPRDRRRDLRPQTRQEVTSEERRYAKVINFGLIYGMSAFGLAQHLGLERATAQAYIDSYFARYPGVQRYMATTRQTAREQGYVETVFGRRLWLPEIRNSNRRGARAPSARRSTRRCRAPRPT